LLDFSKLRVPTPAEREADERRREAQAIAGDRARRHERSAKSVTIELTREAELRYTAAGAGVLNLHGCDERERLVSAIWYAPDDFDRDRLFDLFNRLTAGAALRLDGYWRARAWNGRKTFEFIAQFVAFKDEAPIP
jgi:hypothetical protein